MGKTAMGKTKKENAWRTLSATGALTAALLLQAPIARVDPAAEVDLPTVVPSFEPGVQGFGTIGGTNDFARATEHMIGPAFFSEAARGGRNKLKFDAAVLFGVNRNTPDTSIRFNPEYEI